ncbi:MAG: HAD family hydrolase [Halarsenatibacteraceae bacterium]
MTTEARIKNIVFDIGQVLLTFNPEQYLREEFNLSTGQIKEIARQTFRSKVWLDLDRGKITKNEAAEVFAERLPEYSQVLIEGVLNWEEILNPIEPNVELLRDFYNNAAYEVYALSNFNDESYQVAKNEFSFLSLFKGEIISGQVGYIKPEPEIYQLLLDKFELEPVETLFIDDSKENLVTAEKFGIKTIHYRSPEQLQREIKHLNLLI